MKKENVNERMTNEEKAKEISFNQYKEYPYEGCDGLEYTNDSTIECEKSALEMAEWKDQQFKRALIRKIVEYEKKVHDVVEFNKGDIKVYIEPQKAIKQIINEFFPEQDNSDNDK